MLAPLLGACGTEHELVGFRREPAPQVGDLALPDLTNGGDELQLRAQPGHLLMVFFGYTNCPDVCPTTLSDLRLATRRLDEPDRIDVAMVTVDPERDTARLADYVTGFFDDGHALATDEPARLEGVAAAFGATYEVSPQADGTVQVSHSPWLYAVDDAGELALAWQFGVTVDDLAADLKQLLEQTVA